MELLQKFQTDSEAETRALGAKFGQLLKGGDIVCLNGDLGAGKTQFTCGAAQTLGAGPYITSPTFTIVNEYDTGKFPVYHFDLYRLSSYEELLEIGFEEYVQKDAVLFMEWSDQIPEIERYYKTRITRIQVLRRDDLSPTRREIEVRRFGA